MKNYLAYAAVALLFCVALSLRMDFPLTRSFPVIGKIGPAGKSGVWSGPIPLVPQEKAASEKAGRLELAGRAAQARGDYADAEADYRAETQVPHSLAPTWTWVNLGLMLDYQGKRNQAFMAYQRGFGPANSRAGGSNDPKRAEAVAHFGIMCEDRGLHADAYECYYASRSIANVSEMKFLCYTLDPDKTSSSLVRSLLETALGVTLELERPQPNPEAMAAFRTAARLASGDPRPQLCLAYGLRRAGQFAEAEATLERVSHLDKNGNLKAAVEESREEVHRRDRC